MGEEEPFWGEMARLLAQDDEEDAFHRALEEWEPVQRGGAAVDDEVGGAGPSRGRFDFRLDPFVDRRSQRLGVHERVFRARVHQRGTFDHHPYRVLPILSPRLLRPHLSGQPPGSDPRWQTGRIRTPFRLPEPPEMFGVI